MNIFISGISSGIGKGLAQFYAAKGHNVYGVSRRKLDYENKNIHHATLDLLTYADVENTIPKLIKENKLDLVILNAGVLGKIQKMQDAELNELKATMETNLWSQKVLLDVLLKNYDLSQVIAISSGAAVNGNMGWSGYSLSKAAFNMLIQLYASEYPQTQFIALAPGLVDTAMQDYLANVSESEFPSVKKLHDAKNTEAMPEPGKFPDRFDEALKKLGSVKSGSFVDVRAML